MDADDPLARRLRAALAEHTAELGRPELDLDRIRRRPAHRALPALAAAAAVGVAAVAVALGAGSGAPPPAAPAAVVTAAPSPAVTTTPSAPPAPPPPSPSPPPSPAPLPDAGPAGAPLSGEAACTPVPARSPRLRQLLVDAVRTAAQPSVDAVNGGLAAAGLPPWAPTDAEIAGWIDVDRRLDELAPLPAYDCAGGLRIGGPDDAALRAEIDRAVRAALTPPPGAPPAASPDGAPPG